MTEAAIQPHLSIFHQLVISHHQIDHHKRRRQSTRRKGHNSEDEPSILRT